jgi:two-component system response regulator FixJ
MQPLVYIVDDDRDVRSSISFMLGTCGWRTKPYINGQEFISNLAGLEPACILLDIRMPGIDGVQVLHTLVDREIRWPVVMMTGHGEIPLAVQTMKLGAIDFLEKPFEEEQLRACLGRAWTMLQETDEEDRRRREARALIERLTQREMEVLQGLRGGLSNKLVAHQLGISLRTAEMHRANMMARLGVKSLAEALRIASEAGLAPVARPELVTAD